VGCGYLGLYIGSEPENLSLNGGKGLAPHESKKGISKNCHSERSKESAFTACGKADSSAGGLGMTILKGPQKTRHQSTS
jgi:hypothetical protein